MKRYLLMILGACIAIPLVFASCSSDDDDNGGNESFNMAYYLQGSYTTAVSVSKDGSALSTDVRTYLTITRISDTEATFSLDPVTIDGNRVKLECKILLAADKTEYIKFLSRRTTVDIGGISYAFEINGSLTNLSSLEFEISFSPPTTTVFSYHLSGNGVKGAGISDPASAIAGNYALSLDIDYQENKYKTEGNISIEKISDYSANIRFYDLSFGPWGVYDYTVPADLKGNDLTITLGGDKLIQTPYDETTIWQVNLDGTVSGNNTQFTLSFNTNQIKISAAGTKRTNIINRTLARDIYGTFNADFSIPQDIEDPVYTVTVTSRQPQIKLSLTSPETENKVDGNIDIALSVTRGSDEPFAVRVEKGAFPAMLEGEFGNVSLLGNESPAEITAIIPEEQPKQGGKPGETHWVDVEVPAMLTFRGGSIRQSHIAEFALTLSFTYKSNSYDIELIGEGLQDYKPQ